MTTSRTRRHPSDNELAAWLERGAGDGITDHLDTCDQCAAAIEGIAEATDLPDDDVGGMLREALAPPDDLSDRLEAGIRDRARSQRELREIARLFGLAGSTLRALTDDQRRRGGTNP